MKTQTGSPVTTTADPVVESVMEAAPSVLLGDRAASMDTIARAASISRATLLRRFPSRESLLASLTRRALDDARAALATSRLAEGTAVEAIERLTRALVPMANRFVYLIDQPTGQDEDLLRSVTELTDQLRGLIERGQARAELRLDLTPSWLTASYTTLLHTAWNGIREGIVAPVDAPRFVVTSFVDGCRNPSGAG